MEEKDIKQQIVNAGIRAIEIVTDYFEGGLEYGPKVQHALSFMPQAIKILHMEQHRNLEERSHAIRLLPYLKDEETRKKYMEMTQPSMVPPLEHRPKK